MPGVAGALPRQLADLKQQLLDARERAHRLCDGLSREGWAARPVAERWSVGECLTHLNVTTERFLPLIDEAIREGRARGLTGTGPYGRGLVGWALARWLEPPYRMRTRTPSSFVPAAIDPPAEVLERFDYLQQELSTRIDAGSGLALDRLRLTSPFDGRVKYNLFATFGIILAHQRRHLWQAEQVRAHPGMANR